MDGILLIDKPSGWTSFDVVAKVRGQVKKAESFGPNTVSKKGQQLRKRPRVGHAGTLDPLATGLLVILVGIYCKRASEFTKMDKIYEVSMKLGVTSTTGDEEGEKQVTSSNVPSIKAVKLAFEKYTGEIMQSPHAFSAVKIDGQRAYKLAREGKEFVIEPRKVSIYSIRGLEYKYPVIKFTAKVSSGTYVRSLVEDMGHELKTGAFMTDLRRTTIGSFNIEQAIDIDSLSPEQINSKLVLA